MSVFEEWQRQHTFECPGLSARITPEQCDYNRSHSNGSWGHSGYIKYPCQACETCTDYERLKATVEKRLPQPQEGKTMAKIGECMGCHAPRIVLYSRNLCKKCLEGYNDGDLEHVGGNYVWVCDPLPVHVLQEREEAVAREENETAVAMLRKVQKEEAAKKKQERALEESPAKPMEEVKREDSWPSLAKPQEDAPIIPGLNLVRQEKYRAVSGIPTATIRTGKNSVDLAMNAAATHSLGLTEGDYVDVYKDVAAKVVAFKLLPERTDKNSLRISGTSSERKFSAGAVLSDMGLPELSGHYAIRKADVQGFYIIDFKEKVA